MDRAAIQALACLVLCKETEIEMEPAHPAAADDDEISEEIAEEKQKQEKSQGECELELLAISKPTKRQVPWHCVVEIFRPSSEFPWSFLSVS